MNQPQIYHKWTLPPAGYKLKSNIGALCEAAVKEFEGQEWAAGNYKFCKETGERYEKYGETTRLSDAQMLWLQKIEVNKFPNGVQKKVIEPVAYTPMIHDISDPDSLF